MSSSILQQLFTRLHSFIQTIQMPSQTNSKRPRRHTHSSSRSFRQKQDYNSQTFRQINTLMKIFFKMFDSALYDKLTLQQLDAIVKRLQQQVTAYQRRWLPDFFYVTLQPTRVKYLVKVQLLQFLTVLRDLKRLGLSRPVSLSPW